MSISESKRGKIHIIILTILIILVGFIVINIWVSSNCLVIRNYTANVSRSIGKTIRAVVISDLHDHQFGSNNIRLVEKIAGLKPDIIFMDDYAFGLDGNDIALAAPEDVLTFLKEYQNTDPIKIMLSHRLESYVFGDASKTWDIDLIICGHIHGGQVVFPFIGGLYGGDQE